MNKLNMFFLSAIAAMCITSSTNIQAMNSTVNSVLSLEDALVTMTFDDLKERRNKAITRDKNISAEYVSNFQQVATSKLKAILDEAIQEFKNYLQIFPSIETVKAKLATRTNAAQQAGLEIKALIESIPEDTKKLIYQLTSLLALRGVDQGYLDDCLKNIQTFEDYTLNILALIEIY